MIAEFNHLELSLICQLSKWTPNILWSVGSSFHNQLLQVGRGHAAMMVVRLSHNPVVEPGEVDVVDSPVPTPVSGNPG